MKETWPGLASINGTLHFSPFRRQRLRQLLEERNVFVPLVDGDYPDDYDYPSYDDFSDFVEGAFGYDDLDSWYG